MVVSAKGDLSYLLRMSKDPEEAAEGRRMISELLALVLGVRVDDVTSEENRRLGNIAAAWERGDRDLALRLVDDEIQPLLHDPYLYRRVCEILAATGRLCVEGQLPKGAAEPILRQALRHGTGILGRAHVKTSFAIVSLGELLLEQGRYDEALSHYDEYVPVLERAMPVTHAARVLAVFERELARFVLGERATAIETLRQCEALLASAEEPDAEAEQFIEEGLQLLIGVDEVLRLAASGAAQQAAIGLQLILQEARSNHAAGSMEAVMIERLGARLQDAIVARAR